MEKSALKPDHLLMDPDFEGYKLSLESVPVRQAKLEAQLGVRVPSDEQFSFLHTKLFGNVNLLVGDRFDPSGEGVYLLDTTRENILSVVNHSGEPRSPDIVSVWAAPGAERQIVPGDYNPSLAFADPNLAVFGDGRGVLFVLRTGNRTVENQSEWSTTFHDEICGSNRPFVVTSAVVTTDVKGTKTLHCLLVYVEEVTKIEGTFERKTDQPGSHCATVVEWISLVEATETCISSWKLDRVRRYLFDGSVDYLELDPTATWMFCSTEKKFEIIFDSEGLPDKEEKMETTEQKNVEKPPPFYYMQGVEDMVVWVMLPEGTTKKDLKVTLKPTEITVKVGAEEKLSGKLWNVLDGDSMTWTIQKGNKLEITACKAHEGLVWKRFIQDESIPDGEEVMDPNMVEKIEQEFAQLTTDQPIDSGEAHNNLYNAQELEDCDESLESEFYFYATNGRNGTMVNLSGRQWLFNLPSAEVGGPSRICLRHDVDGLVWLPDKAETGFSLKHVGTLCALGYVQASKQQRKFTLAPSDLSFSAICDRSRHIYIYREPTPLAAEFQLRNRKSGKAVKRVAKQSVVTLEDTAEIVGAFASPKNLTITTKSSVFIINVNNV